MFATRLKATRRRKNISDYFLENGFKNVAGMSGGFKAWRQVYEHEAER